MGFTAKSIPVSNLPHGYERNMMSKMVKEPKHTTVFVVALKDELSNEWEAKIGWPSFDDLKNEYRTNNVRWYCENVNGINGVSVLGDKLTEETARILFPEYADKPYRE